MTRKLLTAVLAFFTVLLVSPQPAQASGSRVSYIQYPAHGGGLSVYSGSVWYALYPGQTRSNVTTARIWKQSCVYWRYDPSGPTHRTCNSGTGNYYLTITASTTILDAWRV